MPTKYTGRVEKKGNEENTCRLTKQVAKINQKSHGQMNRKKKKSRDGK